MQMMEVGAVAVVEMVVEVVYMVEVMMAAGLKEMVVEVSDL